MAHKVIDRCKETTSTTGTGTLTLTGAAPGFVAMANATTGLTADGDTGWFCAENGTEWEVFLGTRVSSTTLARTTVISSSNAGAAVSFTAAPVVFGTVPASKISAVGPSLSAYRASSNQTVSSNVWTKVQVNAETIDTGNCFDSTTSYRWTPNVEGYYQVSFQVSTGGSALTYAEAGIYKNGVSVANGGFGAPVSAAYVSSGAKLVYMNGTTDYLELWATVNGTAPVIYFGQDTYLTAFLAALPGAPMVAPTVAPGPSFRADRITSDQSVTSGAWTKVQLNSETFDTGNCFDSTTNYRFQPNVEGYYQMTMSADLSAASAGSGALSSIYKNGAAALYGTYTTLPGGVEAICTGGGLIYMNGTTDYLELWALVAGTTTKFKFGPATYMTGFLAALPQVPQPTSGPAVSAYRATSGQGITTGVSVKVQLNAEEFDTGACFDPTTNYRFTPNVAGYYRFEWLTTVAGATLTAAVSFLRKNGTDVASGTSVPASTTQLQVGGAKLIYMNGTSDYVELFVYAVGTTLTVSFGADKSFLTGSFVRA